MIFDRLENYPVYEFLSPALRAGFRFLRQFDLRTPDGRIDRPGDDFHVLVQTFHTEPPAQRRFEAHRRHFDLQCVFQGTERIFVAPAGSLAVGTAYDPTDDITFFHDPPICSALVLRPGDFAVFFPGDAHKTCCFADDTGPVRKVVVKIRLPATAAVQ